MSTMLLIEALDRRRFQPMVVLHEEGPLAGHLRDRGMPFTLVPLPVYAGQTPKIVSIAAAMLRTAPRLARFLRREAIEIVHGNDLRVNLTWSAAARLAGRRFVWHQRSLPNTSSLLWRAISLAADHIVCISQTVREALPRFERTPASVVTNPFEVSDRSISRSKAKMALIDELGLNRKTTIIGFVARFVEWKRPETFIAAAAYLAKNLAGPSAFLLVGRDQGCMTPTLRDLAADLGIAERIHFVGFRHPIEPWLSGMDLLMAPSVNEPFGRTLVESMLVGTPVVASRSGGHMEIINDGRTGLLVTPDDPGAFAEAASRILTDKGFAHGLANHARKAAIDTYSTAGHAARVMHLYDGLIATG